MELNLFAEVWVCASSHVGAGATMPAMYRAIRQKCAHPRRVGEVAAELGVSPATARTLIDDMAELGLMIIHTPGGCGRRGTGSANKAMPNLVNVDRREFRLRVSVQGAGPVDGAKTSCKIIIAGAVAWVRRLLSLLPCRTRCTSRVTPMSVPMIVAGLRQTVKWNAGRIEECGRIDLPHNLVLYLFSTPGSQGLAPVYDELMRGGIGALVLVEPSRLEDSSTTLNYLQSRNVPFAVAVNKFDESARDLIEKVRKGLGVSHEVPVLPVDARCARSVRQALVKLTERALDMTRCAAVADEAAVVQTQARVLVSLKGAGY